MNVFWYLWYGSFFPRYILYGKVLKFWQNQTLTENLDMFKEFLRVYGIVGILIQLLFRVKHETRRNHNQTIVSIYSVYRPPMESNNNVIAIHGYIGTPQFTHYSSKQRKLTWKNIYRPKSATLEINGNIAASFLDIISGFSPLVSKYFCKIEKKDINGLFL